MAPLDSGNPFVEKLRARDEIVWTYIENEVIPKVVTALQRWFGPGRGWHDLEGFVRSAERTACRRLQGKTDARLETLECYEDFEKWLVIVAHNKFAMALRKAEVEERHRSALFHTPVGSEAGLTPALGDEAARDVVARLAASLRDQDERTVFHGKLAGRTEAAIARDVGCSTRKVRGIWKRVRERLLREAEPPCDLSY